MLLLLKGTFVFSANYHFYKVFIKLNWNFLGKVISWQSNCVRHPQNAKTTDNNLSDNYDGPIQFWSGPCWRADIWNVQPKGTLFCFRAAAVETELYFLFTARTVQKQLAYKWVSLHSMDLRCTGLLRERESPLTDYQN